ncbi:hypothetical protein STEG23_000878, partial [Scotinomys teguina]
GRWRPDKGAAEECKIATSKQCPEMTGTTCGSGSEMQGKTIKCIKKSFRELRVSIVDRICMHTSLVIFTNREDPSAVCGRATQSTGDTILAGTQSSVCLDGIMETNFDNSGLRLGPRTKQ